MNFLAALKARLFPGWGGMPSFGTSASDWVRYHGNYPGANVDYAALAGDLWRNPVVMACIAWIQRAFPEASLQVVRLDGKEENPIEDHPLVALLSRPNPFTTADQFWQCVIWDLLLGGNAYAVKQRNAGGTVRELWHVPRVRITPTWDSSGQQFIGGYRLQVEGEETRLRVEDVIHWRTGKDPQNERLGYSPFASGLREISLLNEATNYRSAILKNGAVASHFVSPKERGGLTGDQAKAMETLWLNKTTGAGRGRPIFTSIPADVMKLDYSPADLDLGQMTDQDANMLCALAGVSSMVLGITAGEGQRTYANWGEAKAASLEGGVVPLWVTCAAVLTLQLLPDFSGGPRDRCTFDTTRVKALQEDENARWQRYVSAWEKGTITRAALKVALGMDADEKVDNVYFVPTNGALVAADETPEDREAAAAEQQALAAEQRRAALAAAPESSGDAAAQEEAPAEKALPPAVLVQLDDEDWERAEATWDEVMPPEYRGLLSALPTNGKR